METQSSLTPLTTAGRKLVGSPEEEFRDTEPGGREDDKEDPGRVYAKKDAEALARYDSRRRTKRGLEWTPTQWSGRSNAPDEAEEYIDDYYFGGAQSSADQVEDPPAAARQEYESDPFSWGPAYDPPAEAREQYEMPASRAEPVEAASSWSQVVTAAREQLGTQNFVREQAALFEAMPGVPMDTQCRMCIHRTSEERSLLHRRGGMSSLPSRGTYTR